MATETVEIDGVEYPKMDGKLYDEIHLEWYKAKHPLTYNLALFREGAIRYEGNMA